MKASSIALLYVPGAATRPEVRGGGGRAAGVGVRFIGGGKLLRSCP